MTDTTPPKVCLNLGCGKTTIDGFTGLDLKDGTDARKLPYEPGTVDVIYTAHMLEHLSLKDGSNALAHWVDLLKPGGELFVAVPDAGMLIGEMDDSNWIQLAPYLNGGCTDDTDVHLTQYTYEMLSGMMKKAGLSPVRRFQAFANDCSRYKFSLNLVGTKRDMSLPDEPLIVAVMPEPRLTFAAYHDCWRKVIRECKVGEVPCGGAYWEKSLELATEAAINNGADIIVFADYDTLFTVEDFKRLLCDITTNPDVDAVTGVQMSRHNDKPLVLEEGVDYGKDLAKVRFAHFGLTLVRASCFKHLPKPWFMNVPGVGGWDTAGQSDADISFWRLMDMHGFRVFWDNEVLLGHMELCAIWPHKKGVMYQPVRDYQKNGRPTQAEFDPKTFQSVSRACSDDVPSQTEDVPPCPCDS